MDENIPISITQREYFFMLETIKKSIDKIDNKIDNLFNTKAEKEELLRLENRVERLATIQNKLIVAYSIAIGILTALQFFKDRIF